ncbi:LemA family protein, partial [Streptococcus agalactiae]|nr:LemA family protein [Streptococcus agalactiae]MCD0069869.1 LemA family protein [Streptococcus agalactiae]
YNTTTSNYNVKLETFPSNIVGKLFGFKPSQFLETPEEEKEVPKVSFDF